MTWDAVRRFLVRDFAESVFIVHYLAAQLSLGVAQALAGFLVGRYLPAPLRIVLAAAFILTGYAACAGSAHGYGYYLWGIVAYAVFCAAGLHRRAARKHIPPKSQIHVDWVAILCSAAVFYLMYRRPSA